MALIAWTHPAQAASSASAGVAAADALMGQGQQGQAIRALETHLQQDPNDVDAIKYLLKLYLWSGRAGDVIPLLMRLRTLEPEHAQHAWDLAQHLIWAGRSQEAIPVYEEIADKNPKDTQSREMLVKAHLWHGQADGAIKRLHELYTLDPTNDALADRLVTLLIQNGRSKESLPVLKSQALAHPQDPKPLKQLVKVYGWHSDLDGSIWALERLHALDPKDEETAEKLATYYGWTGQGEKSIPILEDILKRHPHRTPLRLQLAENLAASKKTEEAVVHLKQVVQEDPTSIKAMFLLAQICHWGSCWMLSKQMYSDILAQDPNHGDARKYGDLLRAGQGPLFLARLTLFQDSNKVRRIGLDLRYEHPIDERFRAHGQVTQRAFFEQPSANPPPDEVTQLNQTAAEVGVSTQLPYNLALDLKAGGEQFWGENASPTGGATLRGSYFGRLFPSLSYNYATHINRILSARTPIRAHTLTAAIYAEPYPWLAASAAYSHLFLSDGNQGSVLFSGLWFTPIKEPIEVKPGVTLGYENFVEQRPGSDPYYTPDNVLVISPGLDLTWRWQDKLALSAGYSLAIQVPSGLSHNPRASLDWKITPFDHLRIVYNRSGSLVYSSDLLTITYIHRF